MNKIVKIVKIEYGLFPNFRALIVINRKFFIQLIEHKYTTFLGYFPPKLKTKRDILCCPFLRADETPNLTENCLRCMCNDYVGAQCEVKELCDQPFESRNCDLLGFDYDYWLDAGAGDSNDTDRHAYSTCRRDIDCSVKTVLAYLGKHKQVSEEDSRGHAGHGGGITRWRGSELWSNVLLYFFV